MSLTLDQVQRKLWAAIWRSRGHAPQADNTSYWIRDGTAEFWNALDAHGLNELHPPVLDYAFLRASGWETGGFDVPPYGDYAQPPTPWHDVPPYPGDVLTPGTPAPDSTCSCDVLTVPLSLLEDVLAQLAALKATTDQTLQAVQLLTADVVILQNAFSSGVKLDPTQVAAVLAAVKKLVTPKKTAAVKP